MFYCSKLINFNYFILFIYFYKVELKERLKRELSNALKSQMTFIENMKAEYHNLIMVENEKYRELNEKYIIV